MFHITIAPLLSLRRDDGTALSARVAELLVGIDERGSLAAACAALGLSYRHGWQLLREAEALFGQPLLLMTRGKGSQLTPLGARLVWAQRRLAARLSPVLDTLASELQAQIADVLAAPPATSPHGLRIHASHGFAVQALHEALDAAQVPHELKYCGSGEALAALRNGQCDVAGCHVPLGEFEAPTLAHHRPWLDAPDLRLIGLATRRQGLMVRAGNPRKIYDVTDLQRPEVRFVNRQPGSGTRFLLDLVLQQRGIDPATIAGYEQCEATHAAVAAAVASGLADAAFGLEVPARTYKLEFLPLQRERYFLLCHAASLTLPGVAHLLTILRGEAFRQLVDALPGYQADECGREQPFGAVYPSV